MTKSTITRGQATDTEIQMLIDSHEKGTAMFLRVDAYYLMAKELQERRKADSEPVAYMYDGEDGIEYNGHNEFSGGGKGIPLYRHAQQPVVPGDVLDALQKVARIRLDLNDFDGDRRGIADCLGDAEEALIEVVNRRAAMLQELQKSAGVSNNCRSNENMQDMQAGNSPVSPDGYVMVPKEPTKEMIDAGWLYYMGTKNPSSKGTYKAMLAATPQEVPDGK